MYQRENSLGYLINQAARLTHKTMRMQLGPDSPHPAYVPILLWLSERDGQTQSELCARAAIEQPSMAELLKRMRLEGFVKQAADPKDRRRQHYFLTAKAKRRSVRIIEWLDAHNAGIAEGISREDQAVFMKILKMMISNMESAMDSDERKKT